MWGEGGNSEHFSPDIQKVLIQKENLNFTITLFIQHCSEQFLNDFFPIRGILVRCYYRRKQFIS